MKKLFIFTSIALIALAALSCRKATQEVPAKYQLTPKLEFDGPGALEFKSDGGEIGLEFKTSSTLEVKSSSDWVNIEVRGRFVYISAPANNTIYTRYSTVTITDGKQSCSLQAKQVGTPSDYFWESEYSFASSGGSITLKFHKVDATIRLSVEGEDWITAALDDDTVVITVAKNPDAEERTGSVIWKAGSETRTVAIKQAAGAGGGGDNPGDDPGDDPGDFVASFADWIGTWNVGGGRTLTFTESEDYPGEGYVMVDSGYGDYSEYFKPIVLFDEESGDIIFISQKVFEYDIDEYYFLGVDGNSLRFGDEEYGILAEGKMSSAGNAQIVPVEFTDSQGNTVSASALTVLDYQTEDTDDYEAGWYGLEGVEDLSIPANITKSGTSSVPSALKLENLPSIIKKSYLRFSR